MHMNSQTDHANAAVDLLEQRLSTIENRLRGPEQRPGAVVPVPCEEDQSGKLITFEGDGFRVKCQPFPGELIADGDGSATKGNPLVRDQVFVTNGSPRTYNYEYTIRNNSERTPMTVSAGGKPVATVTQMTCQDVTFDLKPGETAIVNLEGRYVRISKTLVPEKK